MVKMKNHAATSSAPTRNQARHRRKISWRTWRRTWPKSSGSRAGLCLLRRCRGIRFVHTLSHLSLTPLSPLSPLSYISFSSYIPRGYHVMLRKAAATSYPLPHAISMRQDLTKRYVCPKLTSLFRFSPARSSAKSCVPSRNATLEERDPKSRTTGIEVGPLRVTDKIDGPREPGSTDTSSSHRVRLYRKRLSPYEESSLPLCSTIIQPGHRQVATMSFVSYRQVCIRQGSKARCPLGDGIDQTTPRVNEHAPAVLPKS